MNPLLTGEENILVRMARMRISFSLKLFWREARNGTQTSLHHKMTQGEDTRKINSLFGFNQQNAGQKWLCLYPFPISVGNQQPPYHPAIVDL
jgi:hypothetical protein